MSITSVRAVLAGGAYQPWNPRQTQIKQPSRPYREPPAAVPATTVRENPYLHAHPHPPRPACPYDIDQNGMVELRDIPMVPSNFFVPFALYRI